MPLIDLFPTTLNPEVRRMFCELDVKALSDAKLREAVSKIEQVWRMEMPPELRDENPESNLVWKAEMGEVLSRKAFVSDVGDRDLIQGISPEFYSNIQWLPGCRVDNGKLIFDPNAPLTRAEAITVISRLIPDNVKTEEKTFADSKSIPTWSKNAFNKLASLGIINGYDDNTIKPNNNITRAEAVKLIYTIF
jgi:hypothetical protein